MTDRLDSIKRQLARALRARLVWLAADRLSFNGEPEDRFALLAVIGREHYREYRKKYPIASRSELSRVIDLETHGRAGVFYRIGPLADNFREVQFFELPDAFLAAPPRALFWIPESVVVSLTLAQSDVAAVSRDQFCYFVASSGINQVRGGAIVSPVLFRMAAGVPLEGIDQELTGAEIFPALERGLRRLRPDDWWSFRGPEFQRSLGELWRPILALTASLALVYLTAVSAYLVGALALREWQLEKLGPEVTPLLEAQRKVDLLAAERTSMKNVMDRRIAVWPMWGIATQVWAAGGSFTGVSFRDGEVVIDGRAPSAIKVLETLSARKDVVSAKFDSAVRQAADQQQFVIRLRLARSRDDGR